MIPIRRAHLLNTLNDDDLVAGYLAGCNGASLPANPSYSFWHGWRNGMSDFSRQPIEQSQRELCRDYLRQQRARK